MTEEGFELFNNEHVVYDYEGEPKFSSLSPIRQRELGRVNSDVLLFYGDSFNLSDMHKVFTRVDRPNHKHYNKRLNKENKNVEVFK